MENTKYKTYCEKALLSSLVNIYMYIINTAIIFNAMRLSYILKFEILAQVLKCKKNKIAVLVEILNTLVAEILNTLVAEILN